MNIQIYAGKKNFDVQKSERYFKERKIPFTSVDLKKHKLGARELMLFIRAAGSARALIDPDAKGEKADYIRHLTLENIIADVLLENPTLLKSPIVRNGNQLTIGFQPEVWAEWK
ncbi:MAG: ArsC family transcriptional regulator [Clostridia bacterium]|nr:ArsC family transcriptional regulator [Clostridia bacterium]